MKGIEPMVYISYFTNSTWEHRSYLFKEDYDAMGRPYHIILQNFDINDKETKLLYYKQLNNSMGYYNDYYLVVEQIFNRRVEILDSVNIRPDV